MKPLVTVAFGGLSADARLPGWTMPFIVRTADRFMVQAANAGGPPLKVIRGGRQVSVVDTGQDAFAREFGTLDRPATPRLGQAAALLRSRG